MTPKQAIKDSISHWKRMIKWAEKQDEKDTAIMSVMEKEIKEDWCGDSCSLCNEFGCIACPLHIKYGACSGKSKNLWNKVNDSYDWKEWTKNAKRFLKQLESLL